MGEDKNRLQRLQIDFARTLLKHVDHLLDGTSTVNSVLTHLKFVHASISQPVAVLRKLVDVPPNSPVVDALRVTSKDIARDRALLKKEAIEKLTAFSDLITDFVNLSRYYPSPEQREYILDFTTKELLRLEEHYAKTIAEQISFELPKE